MLVVCTNLLIIAQVGHQQGLAWLYVAETIHLTVRIYLATMIYLATRVNLGVHWIILIYLVTCCIHLSCYGVTQLVARLHVVAQLVTYVVAHSETLVGLEISVWIHLICNIASHLIVWELSI